MIRKILFLASLLSLPTLVFGQGVAVPPSTAFKVVNGITQPFSGATITVCAANTSGIPCSPVLTGALFFDTGLTQPKPNPFQADANGNYAFAISPGTYTITITGTGFAGYSYQMTSPGTGSGGGGGGGSTNVFANGAVLGPLTFATLPASAANGTVAIISDGTAGPACSAGGAGAIAFRVAGAWTCDSPISGYLGAFTVATLPAASAHTSQLVRITDGTSSSDCSGGGGSTNVVCLSNGSTWQTVGGGISSFSGLSGGTNNSAAMLVGAGASLGPTSTGAITATALPLSTFASLPVAPPTGTVYQVTDATVLGSCGGGGGSQMALCEWNGASWTPVGDGAGTAIGPSFNVRNYGCIADDVTDNATCFANLATAVNAYAGSGVAEVTCDMGPGDKAYLTSGGMNFTVPTYVKGGCTIDVKSTFSGCAIRMGATGLVAFATGQIPPYTVEGLTFTGGSGGATGVCVEPYISQARITRNYFRNFGSSATTSWAANALSPNNEVHMTDNFVWIDDATTGRNGFKCVDTSALGSNTCVIAHNTVNSAQAPGFTGPCGGVGIQVGGAHDTLIANNIYGFNSDIRIDNTAASGTFFDIDIIGGALDSNACVNGTVQSAIQLGAAGNVSNAIRYLQIVGVLLSNRSGLTLFDTAGDNTSGVNLAANVRAFNNESIGGTLFTQKITSAAAYGLNSSNLFGTGGVAGADTGSLATPTIQYPIILGTEGAPTTPGSGMHSFFLHNSTNEAGNLCQVNFGGSVYCYPGGPPAVTASIGGSSIAANSCSDTSVTVTNASITANMLAVATPVGTLAANWASMQWSAYVSALNTVQVHVCNVTTGALTPTAMTFSVKVML
jgi:hypothetical protein